MVFLGFIMLYCCSQSTWQVLLTYGCWIRAGNGQGSQNGGRDFSKNCFFPKSLLVPQSSPPTVEAISKVWQQTYLHILFISTFSKIQSLFSTLGHTFGHKSHPLHQLVFSCIANSWKERKNSHFSEIFFFKVLLAF